MKKKMILLIKIIVGAGLLFGLYVIGAILYAQFTDYKPAPEEQAIVLQPKIELPTLNKDTLIFYDWNIGYCGLGKESDFFYDGGKMVRPTEALSEKNLNGFIQTLEQWKSDADFIYIQEIDRDSKRSYHIDQFQKAVDALGNFEGAFGKNYDVKYIPIPFLEPMGKTLGGIATFYKYKSAETPIKYAFPSNFSWPKGLFFLDRCFVKHRFNLSNGKQLVIINTHNSAYDGGKLKKQEMAYFKKFIVEEYAKGNYVIVGGDWNQIPPGYKPLKEKSDYEEIPVPKDFVDNNWTYAFDGNTPSNRKVDKAYVARETYTTVIDFYLLSPNIKLIEVKGLPNGFEYSDHQPVRMVCKLEM